MESLDQNSASQVGSVWDLSSEQADELYHLRHMNNYVYGALRAINASRWPRAGRWRVVEGIFPAAVEEAANELLDYVPLLSSRDVTRTRVELTKQLFRFYRALPAVHPTEIPQLMRLLASLAFLPLIAERNDRLPLWMPRPVRKLESINRRAFAAALRRDPYEEVVAVLREELRMRGAVPESPMAIVFSITIELVRTIIVMIENGVFAEITLTAFQNVEAAMLAFERRNELGDRPDMPLNVKNVGQVRYRNTLYLYGGNLLERMDRRDEARSWYLRDIDDARLPGLLGFYLTALKTCERLLCAYRVSEQADGPLLDLIHRSLSGALQGTWDHAGFVLGEIEKDPALDLSQRQIKVGSRMLFFSGEPCREPLLAALVYQDAVAGVPYAQTDYGLLVEDRTVRVRRRSRTDAAGAAARAASRGRRPGDEIAPASRANHDQALAAPRGLGALRSSPLAMLLIELRTGVVVDSNAAAEALLGKAEHQIVGIHQTQLFELHKGYYYQYMFERHLRPAGAVAFDSIVFSRTQRTPVRVAAILIAGQAAEDLVLATFRPLSRGG